MKKNKSSSRTTTVGVIDPDVLAYTAGQDVLLDRALIRADCLGSAAHVMMLAKIPLKPRLFTAQERDAVLRELARIVQLAAQEQFEITVEDQDVHLAIERHLTHELGDLGKRVHTGRSRNDQVATALRIFGREQLLGAIDEAAALATSLLRLAAENERCPMAGRTHLQPAMPSTVGLWAAHYAESLLDDIVLLLNAYELNDQCPLGAAASYGVPLPLDRRMTADLLGFSRPSHTVLYAVGGARGKLESIALSALAQAMLTLSRLAEDLILFTMPEFGYFSLPEEYTTGSSIMPQKRNPDVLELVRGKTARVIAELNGMMNLLKNLPAGYNRDVQETKEPFMKGFENTRASLRIMRRLLDGLQVHPEALLRGFDAGIFATDHALNLVARGMPFRDAYQHVKKNIGELDGMDPLGTALAKTSLGAPGCLELDDLTARVQEARAWQADEARVLLRVENKLLGKFTE